MYNARTSLNKHMQDVVLPLMAADVGINPKCLYILFDRDTHQKYPQLRVTHLSEGQWDNDRFQHYNMIQFEIAVRGQTSALETKLLQSFYRRLFLSDNKAPHQRVFLDRLDYTTSLTTPAKIDTMELYLQAQEGWLMVGDTDESVRRFITTMNLYYTLK